MAHALQLSTDQLAELLSESEDATTTRGLSADAKLTVPVLRPKVQSEVWLDRAEFDDLIRPQAADTVEGLRSAGVGMPFVVQPVSAKPSRPAAVGADPETAITLGPALSGLPADIALPTDVNTAGADIRLDTPVTTTVRAGGFAGSDVPERAQADVPDLSSVTTIPLNLPFADVQWRRTGPRRFKRFAAAGVLALGAASVPFMTSDNGPTPAAAAGNPAPANLVAAVPAPDPSSSDNSPPSNDSTGAPAAAPADGVAPSGAAAVPTPKTTRGGNRTASQSKPPASMKAPPPPAPAIPDEADAWSRMAELSGSDQGRRLLRPESPPRP